MKFWGGGGGGNPRVPLPLYETLHTYSHMLNLIVHLDTYQQVKIVLVISHQHRGHWPALVVPLIKEMQKYKLLKLTSATQFQYQWHN